MHKLIEWLIEMCDSVLFALTKYFPIIIIIIAAGVLIVTGGDGLFPGCGGPMLTPTATVRLTVVPLTATPEPTPTLPQSPVSPLQTPGAGW